MVIDNLKLIFNFCYCKTEVGSHFRKLMSGIGCVPLGSSLALNAIFAPIVKNCIKFLAASYSSSSVKSG